MKTIAVVFLTALLFFPQGTGAVQLAVRTYSSSDGLTSDQVSCLFLDDQGFLWVGTPTGLNRFDGEHFLNYGNEHGLPSPYITAIAQTPDDGFWVGTTSGLARLLPQRLEDNSIFEKIRLTGEGPDLPIRDLEADQSGMLWIAAGDRLFRRTTEGAIDTIDLAIPWKEDRPHVISDLVADDSGNVWIGTMAGLMKRKQDGETIFFPSSTDRIAGHTGALAIDSHGRLWCAIGLHGILVFKPGIKDDSQSFVLTDAPRAKTWPCELPARPGERIMLGAVIQLPTEKISQITEGADGTMWVCAYEGGYELGTTHVRRHGILTGLNEDSVSCMLDDEAGNRWFGGGAHGLMRIDRQGFDNFQTVDGLATREIASVTTNRRGEVIVIGFPPAEYVHRLDGDLFTAFKLPLPRKITKLGWSLHQVTFEDHLGSWWVPTTGGLYRFPAVDDLSDLESAQPDLVLHSDDGLGGEEIFRIFEDSRGDVWISAFGAQSVVRWDRSSGRLVAFGTTQAGRHASRRDRHGSTHVD